MTPQREYNRVYLIINAQCLLIKITYGYPSDLFDFSILSVLGGPPQIPNSIPAASLCSEI